MNENRFFRFVWRFNGIILMTASVLNIVFLVIDGYSFITRERGTRNIVNVQGDAPLEEKWQLGSLSISAKVSDILQTLHCRIFVY